MVELTVTGDVAKQILSLTKRDAKLSRALATQWLESVDRAALNAFLLDTQSAVDLLAERLSKAPEATLAGLQALPRGDASRSAGASVAGSTLPAKSVRGTTKRRASGAPKSAKTTRPAKSSKTAPKAAPKATAKEPAKSVAAAVGLQVVRPEGKQRFRLKASELDELKRRVLAFLVKTSTGTRKQISDAAAIPTPAHYNRIMSELRESGDVVAEGERAKRVYALAKRRSGKKKNKGGKQKGPRKTSKKTEGKATAGKSARKKSTSASKAKRR